MSKNSFSIDCQNCRYWDENGIDKKVIQLGYYAVYNIEIDDDDAIQIAGKPLSDEEIALRKFCESIRNSNRIEISMGRPVSSEKAYSDFLCMDGLCKNEASNVALHVRHNRNDGLKLIARLI